MKKSAESDWIGKRWITVRSKGRIGQGKTGQDRIR